MSLVRILLFQYCITIVHIKIVHASAQLGLISWFSFSFLSNHYQFSMIMEHEQTPAPFGKKVRQGISIESTFFYRQSIVIESTVTYRHEEV